MIQSALQTGIVSYAGLTRQALFAMAREAVSEPGLPARFAACLPLFPFELIQNMEYLGAAATKRQPVNRLGFSIDPAEYFRKLYEQLPQLFAGDNRARNFDYEGRYVGRGVMTVDATWAAMFPQYKAFQGERLVLHMLGDGSQGAAAPESLALRGGGVLSTVEATMQVRARAQLYGQYVQSRVEAGEAYDAESFGAAFLKAAGLSATYIGQGELGRALQELAIFRGLKDDSAGELFTESARRGGALRQYTPNRYAADSFEPAAVTRHIARLAQLNDDDFISDLWFPYEELAEYVDRERGGIDAGRLCRAYQIAPMYDPATFGGRYPARLRVIVVRDRDVTMLTGEALNNPAYGDGMSPQGALCRHVYVPGSAELLRRHKLALEEHDLPLVNTAVDCREYLHMLALAALQEHKGKLTDALYRREAALSQLVPGSRGYAQYRDRLDERVRAVEALMAAEQKRIGVNQVSGYDADIDYLRRKTADRESLPDDESEPIAFALDGLRESSVESGYAMRGAMLRVDYAELRLPLPVEADENDAPAEDKPASEGKPAQKRDPAEAAPNEAEAAPADMAEPAEREPDACAPAEEAPVEEADVDEAAPDEQPLVDELSDDEAKPDKPTASELSGDETKPDEAPADELPSDEVKPDEPFANEPSTDMLPADEPPPEPPVAPPDEPPDGDEPPATPTQLAMALPDRPSACATMRQLSASTEAMPSRMAELVARAKPLDSELIEESPRPARPMRELLRRGAAPEAAHDEGAADKAAAGESVPDKDAAGENASVKGAATSAADANATLESETNSTSAEGAPAIASANDTPANAAPATDAAERSAASSDGATEAPRKPDGTVETSRKPDNTSGTSGGRHNPPGRPGKRNKKKRKPAPYEQVHWPLG